VKACKDPITASAFNQAIGKWNTAKVTDMYFMFYYASAFNQPIGNWDTTAVTTMQSMFFGASAFNQKLCWKFLSRTNVIAMFSGIGCPSNSCLGTGTWPGPCT